MVSNRETFSKSERLCSKKAIAELFENGTSFFSFPFHIVWIKSPAEIPFPAQVAISISKKSFKLAVRRNLIKRRIKEAYRKNKHTLYNFLNSGNLKIIFIVIFKDNTIPDYPRVEKSVKEMIETFIKILNEYQQKC
jgi:ribonuclease P protein component